MNFKTWVKSIQTAGYNGARTVSSSPQGLYTMTLASKQSVVVCVQKLKEFYNDVFPELSHESATPQTYVFYIIVHMLVI